MHDAEYVRVCCLSGYEDAALKAYNQNRDAARSERRKAQNRERVRRFRRKHRPQLRRPE
jgi:hypothetical protein